MLRTCILIFFALLATTVTNAQSLPIDAKATAETKNLYLNLQRVSPKGIMFGHQDDWLTALVGNISPTGQM
jgi:mannan endo-1,4-beta-mannosidase